MRTLDVIKNSLTEQTLVTRVTHMLYISHMLALLVASEKFDEYHQKTGLKSHVGSVHILHFAIPSADITVTQVSKILSWKWVIAIVKPHLRN